MFLHCYTTIKVTNEDLNNAQMLPLLKDIINLHPYKILQQKMAKRCVCLKLEFKKHIICILREGPPYSHVYNDEKNK